MKKIPLHELLSSHKICTKLLDDYDKKKAKSQLHFLLGYSYDNRCIDLIEQQIERHGYKKIESKFYSKKDLKTIKPQNYVKDGGMFYKREDLDTLTTL